MISVKFHLQTPNTDLEDASPIDSKGIVPDLITSNGKWQIYLPNTDSDYIESTSHGLKLKEKTHLSIPG